MANIVQIILAGKDQTKAAFTSVTGGLAAIAAGAAAAAGAMAFFTKQAIDTADATGKMAQRAGESVRPFSEMAYAAGLAEVSQQQLATAAKGMAAEMVRSGRSGVTFNEELLRMADVVAGMPDGLEKVALAQKAFGKSGQDMIPLLNQGSAALREQMQEAKDFGLSIGPQFATNADNFNDNMDRIQSMFKGLFLQLADNVLPALIKVSEWFIAFVKDNDLISKAVNTVTLTFKTMGETLDIVTNKGRSFWELFSVGATTAEKVVGQTFGNAMGSLAGAAGEALAGLGGKSMEVVDEADLQKGLKLQDDLLFAKLDGEAKIRAEAQRTFDKQVEMIDKLQIAEADRIQLRGEAEKAAKDHLTDLEFKGELARAEMDAAFRNGQVQRFNDAMTSMEGRQLAHVEATRNLMAVYQDLWANSLANVGNAFRNFSATALQSFSDGFSNAIASIATGAQKANEAFKQLGTQMVGMLVKFVAQLAINSALQIAFGTAIAASATAAMAPVLAINTAAATAASIATLGGANAAGALVIPTMAANIAAAKGLSLLGGIAHGGLDYVPSESTFLLQRGERVLSPRQNEDLTDSLERGGFGGGGVRHYHFNVDGRELFRWIEEGTRDGQLEIHARAIIT